MGARGYEAIERDRKAHSQYWSARGLSLESAAAAASSLTFLDHSLSFADALTA
jgi:hypothetical protein